MRKSFFFLDLLFVAERTYADDISLGLAVRFKAVTLLDEVSFPLYISQ